MNPNEKLILMIKSDNIPYIFAKRFSDGWTGIKKEWIDRLSEQPHSKEIQAIWNDIIYSAEFVDDENMAWNLFENGDCLYCVRQDFDWDYFDTGTFSKV